MGRLLSQQREVAGDGRFFADAFAARRIRRRIGGVPEMILFRREPVSAHLISRLNEPGVPGGTR
jgi:hypothetical protein